MSGSTSLITVPFTMTLAGPQPTPVTTLYNILVSNAETLAPGLTILPDGLISDVTGTQVAGIAMLDQSRVDSVNNVSPETANPFVLSLLGQQFGIPQGQPTNTSVYVVFTGSGNAGPGYPIAPGFTVSDGTYDYVVQSPGGVIETGGSTGQLLAVATESGSWTPGAGSVTQIVTSVPSGYTLTVTNPEQGTAGNATGETVESYRSRVYQAGQSPTNGLSKTVLTALQAVPGVVAYQTALRQIIGSGWQVICGGGGDQYAIAYAIYTSFCDIATLQGSTVNSDRNNTVAITPAPDIYSILYVIPPAQTVTMAVTWNTTLINFTAGASVNQLGAVALVNYLNSIQVGQPINLLEATALFQAAIVSVLSTINLTTLTFVVTVNGTVTPPSAGTSIVVGDVESFWQCAANGVTVAQG